MGWKDTIPLREGVAALYAWYRDAAVADVGAGDPEDREG
jgi:hypothetical protein